MPDLKLELQYLGKVIAGVDEVGMGPLAGPVVASAVIVDQNNIIPGIKDSKKLTPKMREYLYDKITEHYTWSVSLIDNDEIDQINIREAAKKACIMSVQKLGPNVEIVMVDGNMKFQDPRFISIIKGDDLSVSIAASSIVAKVTRDRLMAELAKEFPQYLWHKNSGYGTKEHLEAIKINGLSPYHRKSFKVRIDK